MIFGKLDKDELINVSIDEFILTRVRYQVSFSEENVC